MKLNYVRRFSAYVSTFYNSEYITVIQVSHNCETNQQNYIEVFFHIFTCVVVQFVLILDSNWMLYHDICIQVYKTC